MSTDVETPTLFGDLVAALGELVEIVADETADTGTYKYKYAPLSSIMRAVRPVLARHGLAVSQLVATDGDDLTVTTQIVHHVGGYWSAPPLRVRMPDSPQRVGSAISYLRRYQLVALLGLAIEDDDGASSSADSASRPVGGHTASFPARSRVIVPAQLGTIRSLFDSIGVADADERARIVSDIVNRPIARASELSPIEADVVIVELTRRDAVPYEGDEP